MNGALTKVFSQNVSGPNQLLAVMRQGPGMPTPQPRFSSLTLWLVELPPLLWVLGFALTEFHQVHRNIALTWHWAEDPASAQGVDLVGFVATAALIVLVAALALLFERRRRYWLLVALSIIASIVVIIDTLHANYFNLLPSLASGIEVRQLLSVTRSIWDLFSPLYVVFFLDTMFLLVFWPTYRRWSRRVEALGRRQRVAAVAAGVLFAAALSVPPALRLRGGEAFTNTDKLRQFGATLGVLPYHAFDLLAFLLPERRLTDADVAAVNAKLEAMRAQQRAATPLQGAAAGANLVLVSAESVMGFLVGLEVGGKLVMPRLTAFAEDSLYFTNFHEQTWLGNTSDAEFMALQSLYPLPLQPVATTRHDRAYHALPHLLARAGYETVAASGEPSWMWNMSRMHAALGFQRAFYQDDYRDGEQIYNWVTDKDFFEQSVDKLAGLRTPFMAYLMSSSNHHPFDIPERFRTFEVGRRNGTLLGNYLQAANYFDRAFGALLDRLEERRLLESTVVALYADHQAYLRPERERLAALLGQPPESLLHRIRARKLLPFAVRLPGARHAGRYEAYGGHLDIAPTLLALLGIDDDSRIALGRNLLNPGDPLVAFRDGSFTDGRIYLINRPGGIANAHCIDAESGIDVDCRSFAEKRAAVQAQLDASDMIIEGDLFERLRGEREAPGR